MPLIVCVRELHTLTESPSSSLGGVSGQHTNCCQWTKWGMNQRSNGVKLKYMEIKN